MRDGEDGLADGIGDIDSKIAASLIVGPQAGQGPNRPGALPEFIGAL